MIINYFVSSLYYVMPSFCLFVLFSVLVNYQFFLSYCSH
jgi:hypothetical protein